MPKPDDVADRRDHVPRPGPPRGADAEPEGEPTTWGGEGGAGSYPGAPTTSRPKDVPAEKKG